MKIWSHTGMSIKNVDIWVLMSWYSVNERESISNMQFIAKQYEISEKKKNGNEGNGLTNDKYWTNKIDVCISWNW